MLANATEMLKKEKENKYAIAHFNINNLEWTRFILEEVEANQSPVILGVSEGAAKYMGGFYTVSCLVRALMYDLKTTVPVALHLDHGSSVESCYAAIDAGFTSVMIDASKYSLEENIRMTKEVVHYAHSKGVSVEAEVGHIGGSEDNVSSSVAYCEVSDAVELAQTTGIDFFAPALGSVHGIYKGEPKLDFERLKQVKELTKIPLVLHGASAIPDDVRISFQESGGDIGHSKGVPFSFLQEAIKGGINKVNTDTDLRIAFIAEVRKLANKDRTQFDLRKFFAPAMEAMSKVIVERMQILGSANKI